MDLNFSKTQALMDKIKAGTVFDQTLAASVGSLDIGVTDAVASLKSLNIPNAQGIAASIESNLDPQALRELSSHVSENIGSTMDKLSSFSSFCSMKDSINGALKAVDPLPEVFQPNAPGDLAPITSVPAPESTSPTNPISAAKANLSKAFGAMLSARSMVSSVTALKNAASNLSSLEGVLSSAQGALSQAVAQHASGIIPAGELAKVQALKDEAESKLASAKTGIASIATDLSENLGTVKQKISDEIDFHTNATQELTHFADAMKVQNMFASDDSAKAVMGALGATSFLDTLRDV